MKKYLSRKFLTLIAVSIIDVLIAMGQIPVELKDLLLKLITGIGGVYITVEGVLDIFKKKDNYN